MSSPDLSRPLRRERTRLLAQVQRVLDPWMDALAFVWLWLLVEELTRGPGPRLHLAGMIVWGFFILDFALRLLLAPDRSRYLARNWLSALSLALPALRALRVLRFARALRLPGAGHPLPAARLLRILGSINRGMTVLRRTLRKRKFAYVLSLTILVTVAGAAGMYAFEREEPGGIKDYGSALWWTAMVMTTLGSDYWPKSPEGRMLCFCLALYALAVFGYVTATIATFFLGQDSGPKKDGS